MLLAVDDFLDEHRLVGLERFDQQLRRGRANGAVKVDRNIDVVAHGVAQLGELLGRVLHRRRRFDVTGGPFFRRTRLERRESFGDSGLQRVHAIAVRIDADAFARRPAKQLVDRNAEGFAFDVPQRLIDAAEGTGQNRPAAIERVFVNRLPVMHHAARIFADEIRLDFLDSLRTGQRAAFGDGLAQSDNARIGVDLEEQPARFHQKCL